MTKRQTYRLKPAGTISSKDLVAARISTDLAPPPGKRMQELGDVVRELTGIAARTQEMIRTIGERLGTLETRITAHPEAERTYWFIARVRAGAIQLASWPPGKGKVRWIPDPQLATGFQQHQSAKGAMERFAPSKGTYYMAIRIIL